MLISASYKTDIPAFYGEWLIGRIRAGYCLMRNPYGGQVYRVSLERRDVDGIVLWTNNLQPFMSKLPELVARGYPFYVQYTINGYPKQLESLVAPTQTVLRSASELASRYGAKCLVWRYDTIVCSSLTPLAYHIDNFGRIAEKLKGSTDEVIVSFMQDYRKTLRNLTQAARLHQFTWFDPSLEQKRELMTQLAEIAGQNGMALRVCSQPECLVPGVELARCASAPRLEQISATPVKATLRPTRAHCGCYQTKDIGAYDTCVHGCVYCYAVQSHERAMQRYRTHSKDSEFL